MNTDEDGLKILLLVLPIAALALAAALLYLQDRYRGYRHVSKSARELSEKKGMVAWHVFLLGLLSLGGLSNLFSSQDWPRRIGWLMFTALLVWHAVANWRAYSRLK